ncbi:hypothetical protein ACFOWB_04935 [Chenggangzhangella methanolivorans]|uniref:hypothetical protein n=1 Tax=Chenggangzhangella methanolivorans TaxID=1437009 RepID=UPI00361C1317
MTDLALTTGPTGALRGKTYAALVPDPHAWLLERYRFASGITCCALLIPASGQLQVELITGHPPVAVIRLIERVVSENRFPSSVITDNSLATTAIRKWLLQRGVALSTSSKALAAMERLTPGVAEIAEMLALRAYKNRIQIPR